MMPVLIEGPKEPGNDTDMFLQPLMDDLLLLWKEEGVRVWDEYKLGPEGYKVAVPKWEKMENDLIAKGIVPQTLSWPKRTRYYFYAHGGTLDPDTGMFVTSDVLREATQRLNDVIRRTEEGTFKLNRENDELAYAFGNAEHSGRTRGVGVVPWKYGFSGDLETYRSRCRSKAVVAEKIRSLEN